MLSYRHAFHAGNPADVLKHLVLVRCLEYLNQKDKPYCYIDTHAGAGRYRLDDSTAAKTAEYLQGIARLWHHPDLPPEVARYVNWVRQLNGSDQLSQYPGSPWLARALMRDGDRAFLHEMHPKDFTLLARHLGKSAAVKVRREDGYAACIALLPPRERRGVVLMDPSYEIKEDFRQAVTTLEQAYRRFATGQYLLWYPVVERARIDGLERAIKRSGMRNVQLFELATEADKPGRGMTASGMIVVNPPWTLAGEMERLLPFLVDTLAPGEGGFRVKTLVGE